MSSSSTPQTWPGFIWQTLRGNAVAIVFLAALAAVLYIFTCTPAGGEQLSRIERLEQQNQVFGSRLERLERSLNNSGIMLEGLQQKINALKDNMCEQRELLKEMRTDIREALRK